MTHHVPKEIFLILSHKYFKNRLMYTWLGVKTVISQIFQIIVGENHLLLPIILVFIYFFDITDLRHSQQQ